MGLSQCRPGRDRSVHPACRVRVCNVKLRPSSAPGIAIDSRSFQKELLGPEVRNGSWPCKNALPREVGDTPGPARSQATIAAISGVVPTMFMTRVRL
jgi:hypothetical protein